MTHLDQPGALDGPPEHWGPNVWGELHEVVDRIPCSTCKPFGVRGLRGFHDVVNAKLGKRVVYPADLLFLKREVDAAVGRCHRAGSCFPKPCTKGRCLGRIHG